MTDAAPQSTTESYYVPDGRTDDGWDRYLSTGHTAGPWSAAAQHGGPPAALLARALETEVVPEGQVVARIALDLLGPVPVGPLAVSAHLVRPGRSVQLAEAVLRDEGSGRDVMTARAWCLPARADGPTTASSAADIGSPQDGQVLEPPPSWGRGYLDSVEWRWVEGAIDRPGPATAWVRPLVALVPGERMSPLQRLMTCVDSASGVSSALDIATWDFLNTDLTVHIVRPPLGDWLCLRAATTIAGGGVGAARSEVYDVSGIVGFSAQALLVAPARAPRG